MDKFTQKLYNVHLLILKNKWLSFAAVCLSAFFIYKFGKAIGEFIYYLTHYYIIINHFCNKF